MKIVYHRKVQQGIDDAWSYYEKASPGLGDQFLEELLQVIASIQENPTR